MNQKAFNLVHCADKLDLERRVVVVNTSRELGTKSYREDSRGTEHLILKIYINLDSRKRFVPFTCSETESNQPIWF